MHPTTIIMKRNLLFFLALFFGASQLFAQTGREVTGVVKDTAGLAVFGATVRLIPASRTSDTLMIRTNIEGAFVFKAVPSAQFNLNISSLGYETIVVPVSGSTAASRIVVPTVTLKQGASMLDAVVITGAPAVTIKEDTIQYTAADFKLREDAVVEDLVKRVDGAEVGKDGSVTQNGKAVTRFRIDGKDFFGGDLQTALKNIPANAVDKIQFIDDYGDQAAFTGVRDGDPETIINITTRPGRNTGLVANATAGGGNNTSRTVGNNELYQFNLFATQFKGERNIGITAALNNNNTQIGGTGFGGRGGGGGGNFSGGGGGNAGGNNNTGITTASQIAINYTNRFSTKLQVTGAYNYSNTDRNVLSNSVGESINRLGTIFERADSDNGSLNAAHSANTNIIYNINSKNLLNIRANVSFADATSINARSNFQAGAIKQDQIISTVARTLTPNYGGQATYSHVFTKPGRNLSLNVNISNSESNRDDDTDNNTLYYNAATQALIKDSVFVRQIATDNLSFSGSSRFIYSEPLSETGRLQFSYNINYAGRDNQKITNDVLGINNLVPIDSLSNIYNTSFITQTIGLNYNYRNQNNELQIGVQALPTLLRGTSETLNTEINRSNFNVAPIFRYTYRYSRTRTIQANYNGRAVEPNFNQLQPVRDVTDPQRPIVGNPDLNSSFNHQFNLTYNNSNPIKRTSFLVRMQGGLTQNSIVTNQVLVDDGLGSFIRETQYRNADGIYNYGLNYSTQKSFKDRQYTVVLRGNANFNNSVGFQDNIKNTSDTWRFNQSLALQINPGTWMEMAPSFSYGYTKSNYTAPGSRDQEIQSYSFDVTGRLFFLKSKSLILGFTGGKTFNTGYTGALNVNPFIINAYIEQQFLKNRTATLRLQAFDLLNESTNISRTIDSNGFTDTQTNRLTQYFMLTLAMRINRFAGGTGASQTIPNQGQIRQQGGYSGGQGSYGGGQGGFGGGQGGF